MFIRSECAPDVTAIRQLTIRAFTGRPYSDGSEFRIIDGLRAAGALTLSLVAASLAGHGVADEQLLAVAVAAVHLGIRALGSPLVVDQLIQTAEVFQPVDGSAHRLGCGL